MGHAEKLQQELEEIHRNEVLRPTLAWLTDTIDGLVDDAEETTVVMAPCDGGAVFHVHASKIDIGKVIGKQGRTARSLRTVLQAIGTTQNRRYCLDIVEEHCLVSKDLYVRPLLHQTPEARDCRADACEEGI